MRKKIAAVLEAAGIATGAIAGFTVAPVWGFGILALGLVLFGLAVERDI